MGFGFRSKKYSDKQSQLQAQQQLSEEQKAHIEEFKKRLEGFWQEYVPLTRKWGVDFGITWEFTPLAGPRPNVTAMDIKKRLEAQKGDRLIKPEGGIINPTKIDPS